MLTGLIWWCGNEGRTTTTMGGGGQQSSLNPYKKYSLPSEEEVAWSQRIDQNKRCHHMDQSTSEHELSQAAAQVQSIESPML